jgi:malate dehydrogenase
MLKLGIVGGAGLLGSTTAFCAGVKGIFDEIKLLDLKKNLVMSHVMDLGQALSPVSRTKVSNAEYEDLYDCDVVLVTASLPERKVASRNEFLAGNLAIVAPICEKLKECCKDGCIILNATNPVDVFTYVYWRLLGWDRFRVLGFCANDTLRFKWATERVTGKAYQKIDAICVGEHGEGQVRLYDQMRYDGKPFVLTEAEKAQVEKLTSDWFSDYQALDCGRTSGWTSGLMLAEILEAIATDSGKVYPCSLPLDGEFGYTHVSMGMPCVMGKSGVSEIMDPKLTAAQKEKLDETAEKISGLISSIQF